MIRRIRSRLSVKVFLITLLLVAACCGATYLCIAHFAPYIYTHDLAEAGEFAEMLSYTLPDIHAEELPHFLQEFSEIIREQSDDEYSLHLFGGDGRELTLPLLDGHTGRERGDFAATDCTAPYGVSLAGRADECVLLLSKNSGKESQVVEALEKTLPLLSVAILAVSAVAAFFYAWYLTAPVKRVSRQSRRMADMDFSDLCETTRTDEIGVLSLSLNTLSRRLEGTLAELTSANRQLQADIDRERQLERQRLEFFSAASHELKTPITIIKGQLQGMLYRVGRYTDRETYLAQSLEVTDTLERMVQELLTVSRLDAPGYALKMGALDLSALVSERLSAHEDLFMQRELHVQAEVAPGICIPADGPLLQKAVDNLLGNAAAYSPAGNCAFVKLEQDADGAHLTLENTGAHIPEADIPRLCEAFYRVDASRNRQTGGTGLGLYIAKTILEMHGAALRIENTDRGVLVSIDF